MRHFLFAAGLFALTGCQFGHYAPPSKEGRTIRADVVALDQPLTYNRFGSFNPYGMIYALANDVELDDFGFDSEKLRIGREREGSDMTTSARPARARCASRTTSARGRWCCAAIRATGCRSASPTISYATIASASGRAASPI